MSMSSTAPSSGRRRTSALRLRAGAVFRGILGLSVFFLIWYLLVDHFGLWRFAQLPKLSSSMSEGFGRNPVFGVSVFTSEYYDHLFASIRRVAVAFCYASVLGISIGILCGWNRIVLAFVSPILEIARPVPTLAWIPVVILVTSGREEAVVTLTFLTSFFVTILNTLLGVRSIDEVYFRAARSLGFSRWAILRHVVIPGALPYIFVGLQISMASCWFSLVGAEIVSGTSGLGYKIWEAYYYVQFETMVVMMATLGICGYVSSAIVRRIGTFLMQGHGTGRAMGR